MRERWLALIAVTGFLAAAGCASTPAAAPVVPQEVPSQAVAAQEASPQAVAPQEVPPPTAQAAEAATTIGPVLPRWESTEAAVRADTPAYALTASDVVDISVIGHDDMRKELPVRPDGKISYLYLGDVQAAGMTVEQLRATLEEGLKKYMRYPQVSVVLKKAREGQFSILGKVVRPGVYPIQGPTTIVQAIALAQGLASGQYEGSTIELADLVNSYLVRRNRVVPVDFEALVHRGDTTQDVTLEDGDYIYIPSALNQEVYILGEVYKPRAWGFQGRPSLLQAISESGGFRPTARLGGVVILRGRQGKKEVIHVDVSDIIHGRQPDVMLDVGDVVYVPRKVLSGLANIFNEVMPALLALQLGRSL